MEQDKKPDDEIATPIDNVNVWGLADHEMPAEPSTAEQQIINEAIGEMTTASPTEAAPEISQGSEVHFE